MPPVLLREDRGPIRFLTLNRPEKLNALNGALTAALIEALEDSARDPARAIVIAGAGRAFCAGADVSDLAKTTDEHAIRAHAARTAALHARLSNFGKPVIAAVHGLALGGGCGLAIACDMVVAAAGAQFGYPEITRGVVPALVAPALVRQVGWKAAFELLATGARIDARHALAIGMINRVVPDDGVVPAAESLAIELAGRDPATMGWLKRVFQNVRDGSFDEALQTAREMNALSRIERLARSTNNPA
jgi:enoyl-CoA hydratase/carnithine racemase